MSNKKMFIGIGILVILFLGLLFWPTNKTEELKPKERKLEEPSAEFLMDSLEKINWNISEDEGYTKTTAFLVERKSFSDEEKLLTKTTLTGGNLLTGQYYHWDENRDKYEFSRNVQNISEIENGDLEEMEVKTKFLETMTTLKEVSNALDIKIERADYKQFLYPWWVSGTKEDHDVIEVSASYIFNELPVRNFGGYSVIADYSTSGKLMKIAGQLPWGKESKSVEKTLLTLSELKSKNPEELKIWQIDGGKDYELSEDQPKVTEVDIYKYSLGYIYDFKAGVVWPYYFLEGNTQLSTGPARIILITAANKN